MVVGDETSVSFVAEDLSMYDYGTIGVAMLEGPDGQNTGRIPRTPALLSFETHWQGVGDVIEDVNQDKKFRFTFREATATLGWSAKQASSTTVVEKSDSHHIIAAQVGHLKNGVFF
jgi:hypothetical protein